MNTNASRDNNLTDFGKSIMKDRYLSKGESFQDLFARVSNHYADSPEHAQRLYDYISKLWFMPATPILSNGGTSRGLPISCFLNEMEDNLSSIGDTYNENIYLASSGGGIGTNISNVRSINEVINNDKGKSSGIMPFVKVLDSLTMAISQGCYDDETEILTEKGFIKFSALADYNHTLKVAQVSHNAESFEFVNYTNFIEYKVKEELYYFKNTEGHANLLVTKNHRMATQVIARKGQKKQWKKELKITEADKLSCNRDVRFVNAVPKMEGKKNFLTALERFYISYQADGGTNPTGSSNGNTSGAIMYAFHFSKDRKIQRLEKIIHEIGFKYSKSLGKNNDTTLLVRVPNDTQMFKNFNDWVNLENITQEWACEFIEELKHWDGHASSENSIQYSTTNLKNADLVQAVGIIAGYKTKLKTLMRDSSRQDLHTVMFVKNSRYTSTEKIKPTLKHYEGFVYCVSVPTGLLIVRRQGGVSICGNSLRRGSSAVYLDISHPEIEEFIDIRRPTGGDLNRKCLNIHHGITIPNTFMEAVEKGEEWELKSPVDNKVISKVQARDLWVKILNARIETGEPYIYFSDAVSEGRTEVQKALNLNVKTSNLCVAPETLILVKNLGWVDIKSVANKEVEIWNGFDWSLVVPRKTGENQQLLKVITTDGQELECTPYHKWFIQTQDVWGGLATQIVKQANELKRGDKIIKYTFPVIEGYLDLKYPYANGFYSGDGCQIDINGSHKYSRIYLYSDKKQCENRLGLLSCENVKIYNQDLQNRRCINIPVGILEYKFFVPNADYTIKSRLEWFAGLCDSDGCIATNGSNQSLQIASVNKQFLLNIQKMLQEMGCKSKVSFVRKAGEYLMPKNNGTKDVGLYNCKAVWRILINSNELYKLSTLGLAFTRLKYNKTLPQRHASHFVCINEIIDTGRMSDTYCFTEPKRNMAVFNGILTGNCSEITLPTGKDHLGELRTAVCCLSSLNLEYYEEWGQDKNFIPDVMRFLDNVLSDFIKKAPKSMKNAIYSATRERSVGLGVMGFHSFLQKKMVPIEGVIAKSWNKKMFKHIKEEVDKISKILAEERGACPDAKEGGIMERFSCKTAVAPTASISVIAGNTSPGIEPFVANAFTQKTLSGSFVVKNKYLKELLASKGKDTLEVWSSITTKAGSVQHLSFLTEEEKWVFKTAYEIDQMWLVEHSADRTPFICQAQSFNVFLNGNISKTALHKIHFESWKKGLKTMYYCRSTSVQRADTVSSFGTSTKNDKDGEECVACQ